MYRIHFINLSHTLQNDIVYTWCRFWWEVGQREGRQRQGWQERTVMFQNPERRKGSLTNKIGLYSMWSWPFSQILLEIHIHWVFCHWKTVTWQCQKLIWMPGYALPALWGLKVRLLNLRMRILCAFPSISYFEKAKSDRLQQWMFFLFTLEAQNLDHQRLAYAWSREYA